MTFETFLKKIGEKIATFRKSKALRQTQVAKETGLSYRYYQNIEAGRANMTLKTLFKLARLIHVRPSEILSVKIDN